MCYYEVEGCDYVKNIKSKYVALRCYESHIKILKTIAKREGCSLSDLLVSRTLGIPLKDRQSINYTPKKSKTLAEVFQEEDRKIDPEVLRKEDGEFKERLNMQI
jgi:hypothetical protein